MDKKCRCGGNGENKFKELEPILEKYSKTPGSLITILQHVEEVYGYIPIDAISLISEKTGIEPAKIYGVATFYAQFRMQPVGRYQIMLCQGTACHVNGSEQIRDAVCEHLKIRDGETTRDGMFTLISVACLGCCSLAPVMMIRGKNGDETYGNLTKEKATAILDEISSRA